LDTKEVWRSGGLALGLLFGAMMARAVSFLSARPATDVHAEYVKFVSGSDSISAYIAYPERPDPAPAVLVIHEVFGMSDFVRDATQRLAQRGFVALAPDLMSHRGGTPAGPDDARKMVATLNPDTITQDLDAAAAHLRGLKAVDSIKIGVIGFCWGGGESLRYATHNQSLRAFVMCYGPVPQTYLDLSHIKAIGFGVYADRDGRVTQGLYSLVRELQKIHVDYRFKVYPNTGHGFLRTREPPAAAQQAWEDIISFLNVGLNK
jgi:carboxymethylenebutenolidase